MAGGRFLELSCAAASEGTERLGRTRRGANSVRNSRGARDVGTHPDTPSGSPAPAVPLRGLSRLATSGGDGQGQATRGLLIGEILLNPS
ncbi:hypothetical protein AB1E18_006890 [Capra hircus]